VSGLIGYWQRGRLDRFIGFAAVGRETSR